MAVYSTDRKSIVMEEKRNRFIPYKCTQKSGLLRACRPCAAELSPYVVHRGQPPAD